MNMRICKESHNIILSAVLALIALFGAGCTRHPAQRYAPEHSQQVYTLRQVRGAELRAAQQRNNTPTASTDKPVTLRQLYVSTPGYLFDVYAAEGSAVAYKIPRGYLPNSRMQTGFEDLLESAKAGMAIALERLGGFAFPSIAFEDKEVRINGGAVKVPYLIAQEKIEQHDMLDSIVRRLIKKGTPEAMEELIQVFKELRYVQDRLHDQGVIHIDTSLSNYARSSRDRQIRVADYRLLKTKPTKDEIITHHSYYFWRTLCGIIEEEQKLDFFKEGFPERATRIVFGDLNKLHAELEERRDKNTGIILPLRDRPLSVESIRQEARSAFVEETPAPNHFTEVANQTPAISLETAKSP